MAPSTLSEMLRTEPFQPFRVYLSDGTFHDVRHPEMFFLGVRSSILYVPRADDPIGYDQQIRLDNLHITKVVPLAAVNGTTDRAGSEVTGS